MNGLLKSRKFWIMVADTAFSTAIYFVGKYAAPELGADILWLIGLYQPVVVALISGIAYEDGQQKSAPALAEMQSFTANTEPGE